MCPIALLTDRCFQEIRVRNIEIAIQVPKKFRFPMFSKLVIYSIMIMMIISLGSFLGSVGMLVTSTCVI